MGYPSYLFPDDVITAGDSGVVAITAGTSILIPSTATGSIYITAFYVNCGTASTVQIGYGVAAVASTGSAVKVQPFNIAANSSVNTPLAQPLAIPASRHVLITVVGGATMSAFATYYVAP